MAVFLQRARAVTGKPGEQESSLDRIWEDNSFSTLRFVYGENVGAGPALPYKNRDSDRSPQKCRSVSDRVERGPGDEVDRRIGDRSRDCARVPDLLHALIQREDSVDVGAVKIPVRIRRHGVTDRDVRFPRDETADEQLRLVPVFGSD